MAAENASLLNQISELKKLRHQASREKGPAGARSEGPSPQKEDPGSEGAELASQNAELSAQNARLAQENSQLQADLQASAESHAEEREQFKAKTKVWPSFNPGRLKGFLQRLVVHVWCF